MSTETATRLQVEVRPYRATDAELIVAPSQTTAAMRNIPDLGKAFAAYETAGPGWTLWVNGRPIGAAGLMLMWPGVAHAWLLPSVHLVAHGRLAMRVLIKRLRHDITEHRLVRIQASVIASYAVGRRLAEWIGMTAECTMRRYGPNGEDHILYAWVKEPTP